jgi:hypothetical protein
VQDGLQDFLEDVGLAPRATGPAAARDPAASRRWGCPAPTAAARATDISGAGAQALRDLCSRDDGDARAVILTDYAKPDQVKAVVSASFVHDKAEAALKALGNFPRKGRQPLSLIILHYTEL